MKKTAEIQRILDALFPDPQIPLTHRDPYTFLIAVLLSAQCTDKRVNEVTPTLFALAATPQAMMELPVEAIEDAIRPCGLAPTKSRAISQLSRILVEKHEGTVPDSFQALEALPGVGHKTASVILSQAFGQPAFPVDTHIHRCALRLVPCFTLCLPASRRSTAAIRSPSCATRSPRSPCLLPGARP